MQPGLRTHRRTNAVLLLLAGISIWNAPGCGRPGPKAGLSDRQFAGLIVDVIHLHKRYSRQPDSLAVHRKALFRKRGVTPEALERFIASRHADPKTWAPVLLYLKRSATEGALETGLRNGLGRYRTGKVDTSRGKGTR